MKYYIELRVKGKLNEMDLISIKGDGIYDDFDEALKDFEAKCGYYLEVEEVLGVYLLEREEGSINSVLACHDYGRGE